MNAQSLPQLWFCPAAHSPPSNFANDTFETASVEFDEQKLATTYCLLWGVPGSFNALNIAAGLGLDASLVQAARDSLGSGQVECGCPLCILELLL